MMPLRLQCLILTCLLVLCQSGALLAFQPCSTAAAAEMVPSTLSGHASSVCALAYSPDGRTLASGSHDKTIKVWDAASGSLLRTLSGHAGSVIALAYSPNGRTLASGSDDQTIKVWDAASGSLPRTLSGHAGDVTALAFSPDGRTLASGSKDNTIRVWDAAASGILLRTLSGHADSVNALAYSPDGLTLASGSGDKTIKVWDAASGSLLRTLSGHADSVNALAYSPDGLTLASGSGNKTIKVWNAASGSLLRTLSGHAKSVNALAYSPDGRTLASGSYDKTIKVWDAASGSLLRTLSGHTGWVDALAYSPSGSTLTSGSWDNTIKVWPLRSDDVTALFAYSPDGRTLASGSEGKTIKVWPLRSDDVLGHNSAVAVAEGSNIRPSNTTSSAETEQQRQSRIRARAQELAQEAARNKQSDEEEAHRLAEQMTATQKATQAEKNPAPADTSPSLSKQNMDRPIGDKWALVIGISKFANPAYNLKFAAKDAKDFYNYLITEGNFKKDHVLLLLDQNATQRNIKAAFGRMFLPAVARDGDLVAIYVSTHGTPASKDPGKRNYIVAYDTNAEELYETGIDMDDLSQRVKEGVHTDRVLIVMDTCYSGGGVPGARGVDACGNFDAAQIAQGFGHLVISSSSPNERSWESKVTANGVFTKYLLQNLRLTRGNVKTAFDKLKDDVGWEVQNAFNQSQHPQLGGEWAGKGLILSSPASTSRPILNPELIKLINLQNATTKATTSNSKSKATPRKQTP